MQIRIFGVDPGSRSLGFACIEANDLGRLLSPRDFKILDAGVLRLAPDLAYSQRLGLIHDKLFDLLTELRPEACIIEKAYMGVNAISALRMGETRGAVIAAIRRHNIAVHEVMPTAVKKLVAGQGHASKDSVNYALKNLMGFERGKLPHDVSDALAIALYFGLTLLHRHVGSSDRSTGGRGILTAQTKDQD